MLRRLTSVTSPGPNRCIASTSNLHLLRSFATNLKMPTSLELKIISPTGAMVGLLCPYLRQFWVFKVNAEPFELVCTGEFPKQQPFRRGRGDAPLKTQTPPPRNSILKTDFCSSAISDDFLAVGSRGLIMTFYIQGDEAGCWITTSKLDEESTVPEHLSFSYDGRQLAALVRTRSIYSILIISTGPFPKTNLGRQYGFEPVTPKIAVTISLNSFSPCAPSRITFSKGSTMIAISTTVNDNIAKLQLYKKDAERRWKGGEICYVSIFPHDDPTTWHGCGITGITLYARRFTSLTPSWNKDSYLALSLDSTYFAATDCFKIEMSPSLRLTSIKRFFTVESLRYVGLATSDEHGAVISLDEQGTASCTKFLVLTIFRALCRETCKFQSRGNIFPR
jgi:hypothetical protein